MWTTSATNTIARLVSSALFANYNVASVPALNRCAGLATNEQSPPSSSKIERMSPAIAKLMEWRRSTPYALFIKDHFNEMKKGDSNLKVSDISKKLSVVWRDLSEEQKQVYIQMSKTRNSQYEEEKSRLSSEELEVVQKEKNARKLEKSAKKRIEQMPSVKKPRPAFIIFLSTLDRGNADLPTFVKGAGQRWSQMAIQDKQKYTDLSKEERKQYKEAIVSWAVSQQKTGKPKVRTRSTSPSIRMTENTDVKRSQSADSTTSKKSKQAKKDDTDSSSSDSDQQTSSKVKQSTKSTPKKT